MEWDIFYAPILYQTFFILSTLLVLIVMLNILIALVSQAYEEVMEEKMQANDYERANLIDTLTCALNSTTYSMLNRSSTYEKGQEFLIKVSTNKSSIKEEDPEEKQD